MKKKLLTVVTVLSVVVIIVFSIIWLTKPKSSKNFFIDTIPFFESKTKVTLTPTPTEPFKGEGIPAQTNYKKLPEQITNEISSIEKEKVAEKIPTRINNFITGTSITTTINVFSLPSDPPQSLRIEIYGPNYNNPKLAGIDAIAFKNSFNEIKQFFIKNKVNLNNLQIIYGNRQYIQDTATYWVSAFKLLD